ncbi:DUF1127 domain-containing protein [Pseudomonas sp. UBA4194]|uniref:DUF1127 domain-containing protein n=1 Tax=Pseudomonas sp. UBA4194 TaxID=1947317 RepID=UPI0025CF6CE9|nr:DUF1127 domain-containing protein [Pseudomonas sp. UBA4194]
MKGQKGFVGVARVSGQSSFSLREAIGNGLQRVMRWVALAQQRNQLSAMSDAALKDIGLSRADILQESERPFWDDPLGK